MKWEMIGRRFCGDGNLPLDGSLDAQELGFVKTQQKAPYNSCISLSVKFNSNEKITTTYEK